MLRHDYTRDHIVVCIADLTSFKTRWPGLMSRGRGVIPVDS